MRRGPGWAGRILPLGCLLLALAGPGEADDVNPPLPTGKLLIAGRVHLTVELAHGSEEKGRGLSGRPPLPPGYGMLFVYEAPQPIGIWMKDMRFPLDIIWIQAGRIVYIVKDAPPLLPTGPETVYTAVGDLVLEVPAGFTAKQKIRVGDPVKVTRP